VGGDVYKFVQLKEKVDFIEARRILAERAGISLETELRAGSSPDSFGKSDLAKANEWAQHVFRRYYQDSADGEAARAYVAGRGISEEMAQQFGIGLSINSYDALIRKAGTARMNMKVLLAAGLVKERAHGGYY